MSSFSRPQQQIASATVSPPRVNGAVNPAVAHPAEVVPLPQGQGEGEGANSGGFMAKFQVHFPRSGNDNPERRIISRTHTDAEGWGWKLVLHPWGHDARGCYSAFLELANAQSLPVGFSRYVRLEFALHPWDAAYKAESLKTDFLLHSFNIQATDFGYTRAFEHDVIMAQRNKYIDPQGFVRMSVRILDVKEAFFRVATDADLARSITGRQGPEGACGGDFADWSACLPAKSFKHDQLLYVIQKVAELTGVPLISCRPWLCMPHSHSGGAIRPVAALLPQHLPMTVCEALGDRNQYHIYLEEVDSLPEVWERRRSTVGDIPPDVAGELLLSGRAYAQLPSEVFLVFLKIDKRILVAYANNGRNPGTHENVPHPAGSGEAQFVFIGKAMAHKSDRGSELVPIARNLARLPESVNLEVFEQLGPEEVRRFNGESTVEQAGLQHGAVLLFRGAQSSVPVPPPANSSSVATPSDPAVNARSNNSNAAAASSTAPPSAVSQGYRPSTSGARGGVAALVGRVSRSPAGLSAVPAVAAVPPSMTPILPTATPISAAIPGWSAPASAAVAVAAAAAAAAVANSAAGRLVTPFARPTPPIHSTKLPEVRSAVDPVTARSLLLLPTVPSSCGRKKGMAVGAPGWEGRSMIADAGAGGVGVAVARGWMAALSAQQQHREEANQERARGRGRPEEEQATNAARKASASASTSAELSNARQDSVSSGSMTTAIASNSCSGSSIRPLSPLPEESRVARGAAEATRNWTLSITEALSAGAPPRSPAPPVPGTVKATTAVIDPPAVDAARADAVAGAGAGAGAGTGAGPGAGATMPAEMDAGRDMVLQGPRPHTTSAAAAAATVAPSEAITTRAPCRGTVSGEDTESDQMMPMDVVENGFGNNAADELQEGSTPPDQQQVPDQQQQQPELQQPGPFERFDQSDRSERSSEQRSEHLSASEVKCEQSSEQSEQGGPAEREEERPASGAKKTRHFTPDDSPATSVPPQQQQQQQPAPCSRVTRARAGRMASPQKPQPEPRLNPTPEATTRAEVQRRTPRKGSDVAETRKTRYSTRAASRGKRANGVDSSSGADAGSGSGVGASAGSGGTDSRADSCTNTGVGASAGAGAGTDAGSSSGSGSGTGSGSGSGAGSCSGSGVCSGSGSGSGAGSVSCLDSGSGSGSGFGSSSDLGSGGSMQQGNGSMVHSTAAIEASGSRMNPHRGSGDGGSDVVGGTARSGGSKGKSSERVGLKRAADGRWIEGEQQRQRKYARQSTSDRPAADEGGELFVGLDAIAMLHQIHQVEGCNMDKVLEVMKSAESIQIAKAIQSVCPGDDWRAKQVERLLALREKSADSATAVASSCSITGDRRS